MKATKHTRNWKSVRPNSLRHALELCKEFAREKHNMSVERLADAMGVADQWTLYRWLSTGKMPALLIRPYETACGIDFVTRWIAASSGKLVVDIPCGRKLVDADLVTLHTGFGDAVRLITDFYAGKSDPATAIAALSSHMESIAWHRANVAQHATPEFDFSAEDVPHGH